MGAEKSSNEELDNEQQEYQTPVRDIVTKKSRAKLYWSLGGTALISVAIFLLLLKYDPLSKYFDDYEESPKKAQTISKSRGSIGDDMDIKVFTPIKSKRDNLQVSEGLRFSVRRLLSINRNLQWDLEKFDELLLRIKDPETLKALQDCQKLYESIYLENLIALDYMLIEMQVTIQSSKKDYNTRRFAFVFNALGGVHGSEGTIEEYVRKIRPFLSMGVEDTYTSSISISLSQIAEMKGILQRFKKYAVEFERNLQKEYHRLV